MELYRTLFTIEVLSDRLVNDLSLKQIAEEIDTGDCSGKVECVKSERVSAQIMARSLQAQGSDPSFLLGEDGWKYAIRTGDEIKVHGITFKVRSIEWNGEWASKFALINGTPVSLKDIE